MFLMVLLYKTIFCNLQYSADESIISKENCNAVDDYHSNMDDAIFPLTPYCTFPLQRQEGCYMAWFLIIYKIAFYVAKNCLV